MYRKHGKSLNRNIKLGYVLASNTSEAYSLLYYRQFPPYRSNGFRVDNFYFYVFVVNFFFGLSSYFTEKTDCLSYFYFIDRQLLLWPQGISLVPI